jgi:hypothetical protein
MFLFVKSSFYPPLPSDLASQLTPLLWINSSHWLACSGLSPLRTMVCVAHNKKARITAGLNNLIPGDDLTRMLDILAVFFGLLFLGIG